MDPVSAAILAALATGALAGVADTTRTAVMDLYQSLKSKLVAKFTQAPDVSSALAQVEQRPDSPARRALLAEEMQSSGAAQDPELLELAQRILDLLSDQSASSSQVAIGAYIAQADRQSQASVTIENPRDQD